MRTHVFVIPSAFRANVILRTGIYRSLSKEPDTKLIIVSPFAKDETFVNEFPTAVHVLAPDIPLDTIRRIARIREILLSIDHPVLVQAKLIEERVVKKNAHAMLPLKERLASALRLFVYPFRPLIVRLTDMLEERVSVIPTYDAIMKNYRPDSIVMGTLTEPHDILWLALSRRYQVNAHAVDLPWSYMETRLWAVPRRAHIYV